ncbi:hypothetical protein ACRB8A_19945 (plasmid) [Arthrobacter sp. G.S.26]|uniref:hypothetical protein n=1 Tax=Arthrobacter sp. G.S.26 TaxID=3433706 RepID=UPI003D771B26
MSQPGLVESISIASHARHQLLEDTKATNSPYKNDPVPHQDDLAKWLRENKKFEQQDDGTWAVSRTNLHEAIAALGNGPTP